MIIGKMYIQRCVFYYFRIHFKQLCKKKVGYYIKLLLRLLCTHFQHPKATQQTHVRTKVKQFVLVQQTQTRSNGQFSRGLCMTHLLDIPKPIRYTTSRFITNQYRFALGLQTQVVLNRQKSVTVVVRTYINHILGILELSTYTHGLSYCEHWDLFEQGSVISRVEWADRLNCSS